MHVFPAGPTTILLLLAAAPRPAGARLCDEDDVDLIRTLARELTGARDGTTDENGPSLDDGALEQLAAEAGCEWFPDPGGPAEEWGRLQWRADGDGTAGPAGLADPRGAWWRVLLPRIELRWVGRIETAGGTASWGPGWTGWVELWVLWTLVPAR